MLDRVRDANPTPPHRVDWSERLAGAKGSCLVLGLNTAIAATLALMPETVTVQVATTDADGLRALKRSLPEAARNKVFLLERTPFGVQRRDMLNGSVDFLVADLWKDPWDRTRVETMRTVCRELRPFAVHYAGQEIDVVAEWLGHGYEPDRIDASAIDIFRIETGILIGPRTNDYGRVCLEVTMATSAKGRGQ